MERTWLAIRFKHSETEQHALGELVQVLLAPPRNQLNQIWMTRVHNELAAVPSDTTVDDVSCFLPSGATFGMFRLNTLMSHLLTC